MIDVSKRGKVAPSKSSARRSPSALISLEARIVAGHAPRPNRCFGYGIVLAVRRSVVLEKFTRAIVRSVVSRDARPIGQRSFRLSGNRRRHHQIPAHKRKRGCVVWLHWRSAYGLSGNRAGLITVESVQRLNGPSSVHVRELLLLLPKLVIAVASQSSTTAVACRDFIPPFYPISHQNASFAA